MNPSDGNLLAYEVKNSLYSAGNYYSEEGYATVSADVATILCDSWDFGLAGTKVQK